jgi:hypothetical protein
MYTISTREPKELKMTVDRFYPSYCAKRYQYSEENSKKKIHKTLPEHFFFLTSWSPSPVPVKIVNNLLILKGGASGVGQRGTGQAGVVSTNQYVVSVARGMKTEHL